MSEQVPEPGMDSGADGEEIYQLREPEPRWSEPERPVALPLSEAERDWAEARIRRRSVSRFSLAELLGTTTLLAVLLGLLQWTPLWLAGLILGAFTLAASWVVARAGVASRTSWITLILGLIVYAWVAFRAFSGEGG